MDFVWLLLLRLNGRGINANVFCGSQKDDTFKAVHQAFGEHSFIFFRVLVSPGYFVQQNMHCWAIVTNSTPSYYQRDRFFSRECNAQRWIREEAYLCQCPYVSLVFSWSTILIHMIFALMVYSDTDRRPVKRNTIADSSAAECDSNDFMSE